MDKTEKKEKKFNILRIISNNCFMLSKVAKHAPGYFVGMIVEGVAWGVGSAVTSIYTYNLLNAVSDGTEFSKIVLIIGAMALFYLLMWAIDKSYWHIFNPVLRRKLLLGMHGEIFLKARETELAAFDDPEFYNDFIWAMNQSAERAVDVVEDTGKLINRSLASGTLFTLLLTIDPVISAVILLLSVIKIIAITVDNKLNFEEETKRNPLHRKKAYVNRVFRLSDFAKELRITHAPLLLEKEYDETVDEITRVARYYGMKHFLCCVLSYDLMTDASKFALLIYMTCRYSVGAVTLGGLGACVNAALQFQNTFSDLIDRISRFPKHSMFIEKYRAFLDYDVKIKSGEREVPPFESLELRNVSFAYKNAEALKNVSLKIAKGDKAAIVGYNGAGKTTLIKLLMRLYDPTSGEILYNGVNIKEYNLEQYRGQIGTVFQDFKIFAQTVAENVMNGEYDEGRDRERVLHALECADFTGKLCELDMGLDTPLTREFNENGVNLSGGESQKVAIARVFAADHSIVIMDEPSSALDPTAEYNLNRSILENTKDKTVIFISHRLSTTRIADEIFMFADGSLIEQGSHNELMAKNGKYAEMFRLQSEKYTV